VNLAKLTRAFALTVGAVGVAELLLVAVDLQYPPQDNPLRIELPEGRTAEGDLHERSITQLWRPKPGGLSPWSGDRMNSLGLRGAELAPQPAPGVLRIAALGDSSTFGYGLRPEEAWVVQLAATCTAAGVVAEPLNAGVVGFSARQGLERYREVVAPLEPQLVVAAFGAIVDHVPAMGYSDARMIEESVLAQSDYVLWARRMRSDLRVLHMAAWCVDGVRGERTPTLDIRARDFRASVVGTLDWPGQRRVSPAEFAQALRSLRREVEASGARLVLLSMPRKAGVEYLTPAVTLYTQELHRLAQEEGFVLADGRAAFGRAVADGRTMGELFLDNFHPTALGQGLLAQAVYAAAESSGALQVQR
jgi:lysophospholipase L1-like esterase